MTALRVPPARPASPPLAVRARDLLACEWTKLRSVRSTYWTLLIAILAPIAVSALLAFALTAGRKQSPALADPMLPGFVSLEYAVLAVSTLGVLVFTAEYSSGLAATTFAAMPRRWAVLTAKATVTGVVTLITGEAASFTSFFIVQAIMARKHIGVSLAHPGAAGAVAAEGALLMVCALLGVGVGAMIRHTAGGSRPWSALSSCPPSWACCPRRGTTGSTGSCCSTPPTRWSRCIPIPACCPLGCP